MDWKLELMMVPVSDVDRARTFYTEQVGFHADHDQTVNPELRFVQLTPPGSACSIAIGKGITKAVTGSVEGLQMVVAHITVAHAELSQRGVEVSNIQDLGWRAVHRDAPDARARPGAHLKRGSPREGARSEARAEPMFRFAPRVHSDWRRGPQAPPTPPGDVPNAYGCHAGVGRSRYQRRMRGLYRGPRPRAPGSADTVRGDYDRLMGQAKRD